MKKFLFGLIPLICFGATAAESSLFHAQELTLDLYSSYTASEPNGIAGIFDTNARHGKFGAGIASTWWATRNFGVSLDTAIPALDNVSGVLFDQVSLSFSARLPIGHVSPYAFGGIGRDFESGLWNSHVGAGIEVRLNPRSGLFLDARYLFASHETDWLTIRSGVRFSF